MKEQITQSEQLYAILYSFFKRKYLAAAIFIATFVGILFGTFLTTSLWQATAKVWVQHNPKQQLAMFKGITTPGSVVSGVNPANDVIQMLVSRELAEEVAKAFERDKLWEKRVNAPETMKDIIRWHISDTLIGVPIRFLRSLGILRKTPDNYLAMAVKELQEDLQTIELEAETTVVNISIWGESPEIATDMTNKLVDLLIEKNLESSRMPIAGMMKATAVQLSIADESLKTAQENMRNFKEKSGLVLYNEEASILLKRHDEYKSKFREMESQMAALKIEKHETHPEVKSLEAKIREYRGIIRKVKRELKALPLKEVEVARLGWELEVRENLYSMIKEKYLELEALKSTSTGDLELKIIDKAKVYSFVKPDWPRWVINILLGFVGSGFLSIGFVFFVEYWDTSFKSVKELEDDLQMPVLGSVPKLSQRQKRKLLDSLTNVQAGNVQSLSPIRRLLNINTDAQFADMMLLENRNNDGQLLLVTSPGQREGKTTYAAILGRVLSHRAKKVLVIDANLRRPELEEQFDEQMHKGLIDYYVHNAGLEDIVVSKDGVDIIFAGNPAASSVGPLEMFTSQKMAELFQRVRMEYDFIIVDSPPIKGFKDPLALAAQSDGVVLVVEANQTPRRSIVMAIDKIQGVGGTVAGIVLNKQVNYVPKIILSLLD